MIPLHIKLHTPNDCQGECGAGEWVEADGQDRQTEMEPQERDGDGDIGEVIMEEEMQRSKYFKKKRKNSTVWHMEEGQTKGHGAGSKAVGLLSLDLSHRVNSAAEETRTPSSLPRPPILKASFTPVLL